MKRCYVCENLKPNEDFSWARKDKGLRQTKCRDCTREYGRKHYQDNKDYYKVKAKQSYPERLKRNRAWLKQYLLAHPCECGEGDIEVLQFDHNEPLNDSKAPRVATDLASRSISYLEKEVAKCTVRCANCHLRITRKQMGWSWEPY